MKSTDPKEIVKNDQIKAATHVERLKTKVEKNEVDVDGMIRDEDIAIYWSHPDTSYLQLSTLDFINYLSKKIRAVESIIILDKIAKADPEKLQELYVKHTSA